MLDIGPVRLSVFDLLTLIPPRGVEQLVQSGFKVPSDLERGWLSDTVIEAFLWQLCSDHRNVFAADASMCTVVQLNASTRRLWHGQSFTDIDKIIIPMNKNGGHWTMLALDRVAKVRYYFDSLNKTGARQLKTTSPNGIAGLIQKLSSTADIKTGWKSTQWPCIQPSHVTQLDRYNCGVFVCFFARCISEGVSIPAQTCDIVAEREKLTAQIFGFCYDDIEQRNTGVCKVCRDDDGEDWLGCDACGQFFHASCLDVDYVECLAKFFRCPC
ncbi:uncharacterized protein LOC114574227 [Exaiptasia diaphana]|uniref:Ubiquitin-like protease family profile domain-containing protein n=1 Tax=Exaiptasia diaphana TaxID=2652724 RepID=A0A913YVI5_EXADI|nr:uncharacterized protein LOC114574227 [Exaiptasia diaphana]